MEQPDFKGLVKQILHFEQGSDAELTVAYLRDVSLTLSLVGSVREANIEKHLQAEQKMACLTHAYDHPNHARYEAYQNAYLMHLKQTGHDAYKELKIKGIGGSITGEKFSAIHGDLITELYNKETKGTAGPFRAGFSTDIEAVNNWVNTIHIHALLRTSLHRVLSIKTSSKHKELTGRGKRLHAEHVKSLKMKLNSYGVDPFSTDPPRQITSGKKIDDIIVYDMFRAPDLGWDQLKTFIDERLIKESTDFFSPIKRNNLSTGKKEAKI